MVSQLTEENMKQSLKDVGCDPSTVKEFLISYQKEDTKKQILFLKCQRCMILEHLHQIQKNIDCLDYLIYIIKKGEENEKIFSNINK